MCNFSAVAVSKNGTVHKAALIAVARSVSSGRGDEGLYTKVLNLLETTWERRRQMVARQHKCTTYLFSRKTLCEEIGNQMMVIEQNIGFGVTAEILIAVKSLKC